MRFMVASCDPPGLRVSSGKGYIELVGAVCKYAAETDG